jgi:subtilisin family serine protease
MISRSSGFLAALLLLAGCAGASTEAPRPAPTPVVAEPFPAETPAPAPVPEADPPGEPTFTPYSELERTAVLPREAPGNWQLLDQEADGIPGASVEEAYREPLAGRRPGRTVVVAVIDGGVDTSHVDLRGQLWTNPGETPGDGVDNDGNGYVDDVRGWNFLGGGDGISVEFDTYEVTRLFAGCVGGEALAVVAEGVSCETVQEDFQARRGEAEQILETVTGIAGALEVVLPMLRAGMGTDSLTPEKVQAFRPIRQDHQQARGFYLQLTSNGITPADVEDALEELQGQVLYNLNPDFNPRPIVGDEYGDLDQRGYGNPDIMGPDASHGTHVAGIIAALRGNDVEAEGVLEAVRIMGIRAVPRGDEHDKDVANAIRYAADHGAHIINMSFGKSYSPQKEVVDAAVRYADSLGVLMVHAAGNDGADLGERPSYPNRSYLDGGGARNWITVGASGWSSPDSLAAPFSNYGENEVDLFAPGVDILSTLPGGGVGRQQGTSMAAPLVSGVAALLMAYYPELTAAQVKEILLETATRHPDRMVARPGDGEIVPFSSLSITGGIVNARAAVERAEALRAEGR